MPSSCHYIAYRCSNKRSSKDHKHDDSNGQKHNSNSSSDANPSISILVFPIFGSSQFIVYPISCIDWDDEYHEDIHQSIPKRAYMLHFFLFEVIASWWAFNILWVHHSPHLKDSFTFWTPPRHWIIPYSPKAFSLFTRPIMLLLVSANTKLVIAFARCCFRLVSLSFSYFSKF